MPDALYDLSTPSRTDFFGRGVLAGAIALAAAWLAFNMADNAHFVPDFEFWWLATRRWLTGTNPYAMRPETPEWHLHDRLFYPLPALLVTAPIAWLSVQWAAAVFVGLPTAMLAWRLSRIALWPLLLFASPSFLAAASTGQWSPWLVVAMLYPAVGFVFACKPTLGLACFAYRPTRRAAAGGVIILLVSLALMPHWPRQWLDNLQEVVAHPAPIRTPFGWLIALAVLRWRRREARLFIVMACVPQLLLFADQLPLALVVRTRRGAWCLVLSSWVAFLIWWMRFFPLNGAVNMSAPYVMVGCYLPALWIVLRQPNEGPVPAWLERQIARWPFWLRGQSSAERALTNQEV